MQYVFFFHSIRNYKHYIESLATARPNKVS